MAIRVGSGKDRTIAEINVTPMADVMIVLLIIFMVTVPLMPGRGVRLPEAANAANRDEGPPLVVVRLGGEVEIQFARERQKLAAGEALRVVLEELAQRVPADRRELILHADAGLLFAEVSRVMAACHQAGFEEISLATRRSTGTT